MRKLVNRGSINRLQDPFTLRRVPVIFTDVVQVASIQNYFQFEYVKKKIKFIILFFQLSLRKSFHYCGKTYNTK